MFKKIVTTFVMVGLLYAGETSSMEAEAPNSDTVNHIVKIIRGLGLKEDTHNHRHVVSEVLRREGTKASHQEIDAAFQKSQEFQEKKAGVLTPTEKENTYKTWLMEQAMKEQIGSEVPKDITSLEIGDKLHRLSLVNPVLEGQLIYRSPYTRAVSKFKIKEMVKTDGTIDLSSKQLFGDISQHLTITTDPEKFFHVGQKSWKIIILIAPRSLIEEKLKTTAKPFEKIMTKWNGNEAPIGIFWRSANWDNLDSYDYLTTKTIDKLSNDDLYELWRQDSLTTTDAIGASRLFYGIDPSRLKPFRLHFNPK